MGSRFALRRHKRSRVKHLVDKRGSEKEPKALTLCPFSPGSPARPSKPRSPCRGGEEEEERPPSKTRFTRPLWRRRGPLGANVTAHLGSRLSRHASRTVGSGSALRMEQRQLDDGENQSINE